MTDVGDMHGLESPTRAARACWVSGLVLSVALVLGGCSTSSSECRTDADCEAGERCLSSGGVLFRAGTCVPRGFESASTRSEGDANETARDAGIPREPEVGPDLADGSMLLGDAEDDIGSVGPDASRDAAPRGDVAEPCRDASCPRPTCRDDRRNGSETSIDCGGPTCEGCPAGAACQKDRDCRSKVCEEGECAEPSCSDGVQNGDETSVDCGGSCTRCLDAGKTCEKNDDCKSGVCSAENGVCETSTCSDGVRNGEETDVDCGGSSCGPCSNGSRCKGGGDCNSNLCLNGTCRSCQPNDTRKTQSGGSCGYEDRGTWYDRCTSNHTWKTKATCKGVWYESCKEYMEDHPNASAGRYELDVDGPSGKASKQMYFCDADGWTRLFAPNFNKSASGWSPDKLDTCGKYDILGRFGSETVARTYNLPPVPHEKVRVSLRFLQIDNWESSNFQKDKAGLELDGNVVRAWRGDGSKGQEICGRSSSPTSPSKESLIEIEETIQSSKPRVEIAVQVNTTTRIQNESWGLDRVVVWVK